MQDDEWFAVGLVVSDLDEWLVSVNIASGDQQQQQVSSFCSFLLWGDLSREPTVLWIIALRVSNKLEHLEY